MIGQDVSKANQTPPVPKYGGADPMPYLQNVFKVIVE